MQIQKYIPILLVTTFLGSTLITGCKQNTQPPIESSTTDSSVPVETFETIPEETTTEAPAEESTIEIVSEDDNLKSITITVFNSSKLPSDNIIFKLSCTLILKSILTVNPLEHSENTI